MTHENWIYRCLDLARKGAGRVSPNPLVGAVIVGPDGSVIGEGFHGAYGGPHAEVEAIRDAEKHDYGERLKEATLYVNLEPCSHHGKTPPCADLIVEKEIPRVVLAMQDPNPDVAGRGIQRLRDADVDVTIGVLENQAKRLNEAFSKHITTDMPLVTLKIARSLDGYVARGSGGPTTISSTESRTLVHRWRSEVDGVLIGAGTARADDPRLTVRHVEGRQPFRIVLDRAGELSASLRLLSDEYGPNTIAICGEDAMPAYAPSLIAAGGRIVHAPENAGHLDLRAILEMLGRGNGLERPLQSVLVEAGPGLSTALLEQDLVDRLYVFTSPILLGDGVPAFYSQKMPLLTFVETEWEQVGEDVLFRGYLRGV